MQPKCPGNGTPDRTGSLFFDQRGQASVARKRQSTSERSSVSVEDVRGLAAQQVAERAPVHFAGFKKPL